MSTTLNEREAYTAMYIFLDEMYRIFGSDAEIGGILGSMSFAGELPIDRSLWLIGLKSIEKAKNEHVDISIKPAQESSERRSE